MASVAKITKYKLTQPAKILPNFPDKDYDLWIWVLDKDKKYIRCFIDSPYTWAPQKPVRELLPPDFGVWHYAECFQSFFPSGEFTHWPVIFEVFEIDG